MRMSWLLVFPQKVSPLPWDEESAALCGWFHVEHIGPHDLKS